ncbi:MAG TPA: hypothetical protein VFP09_14315, partial [Desertimonas sp.]|nr:hypothetical protein [Desertimonas sp.]
DTDWGQILQLYDQLLSVTPTPVVALNRAVALAEIEGPAPALVAIEGLDLDGYAPFHVTRGELFARLGSTDTAAEEYDKAIALTANEAERRFLVERRDGIADRADADS